MEQGLPHSRAHSFIKYLWLAVLGAGHETVDGAAPGFAGTMAAIRGLSDPVLNGFLRTICIACAHRILFACRPLCGHYLL